MLRKNGMIYTKKQPPTDDLQLFFDRDTKGIEKEWENTPSVRVSLLQFHKVDERAVNSAEIPLPPHHLLLALANKDHKIRISLLPS